MKKTLQSLSIILCFLLFTAGSLYAHGDKYHRVEVKLSKIQFKQVMDAGLDIDHYSFQNGLLIAEMSDTDIELLDDMNINVKYVVQDLEKNMHVLQQKMHAHHQNNANKTTAVTVPTPTNFGTGGSYGTSGGAKHFTFAEMQAELDQMRLLYPNLITVKTSIGSTYQSRQLYMVKISDNADIDENEPEVFLNAVHHAREPMSMTQLIYFMWYALENYATNPEIKTLLNSTELYVVPCVNPDGYVYNHTTNPTGGGMWRKNRRPNGGSSYGVDNNRNYAYGWGGSGSSGNVNSSTYRGTAPFSELENQAIRNFTNSKNFVSEFNYHSYGNYCIYPYSNVTTNNNPEVSLFNQLSSFLTEDNNFTYGNAYATVNYVASGGAEDWSYGEQTTKPKVYGFTPEVGASSDGFYPTASRIIPLCNSMIVMNTNLLKVSTKYAEVTTNQGATVNSLNGTVPYSIKFYSLLNGSYSVSLNPLSTYVTNVGGAGTHTSSSSTIFSTQSGTLNYTLSASTPNNTAISFEVLTDNGLYIRRDTITINYTCPAPTGLASSNVGLSSATVSWNAVTGVTDYVLQIKQSSSSIWGSDIVVLGLTHNLTGLSTGTSYDVRVRTNSCNSFSGTSSFTTLIPCGTASPSSGNATNNSFDITWASVPGSLSYTVNYRQQGSSSWTAAVVSGTSYTVAGLSSNTTYEYRVQATCTIGNGAFSTTGTETTSSTPPPPPASYCSANGNNNYYFWIDYIELNTISRTSGRETGGYTNTNLSTDLVIGNTYNFKFSTGFNYYRYRVRYRMYIDYNADGDFTDAGEQVIYKRKSGSGTYSYGFTVPSNITAASTKMRVVMSYYNFSSPCGVYSYGEVEDYDINLITGSLNKTQDAVPSNELAVNAYPNPFNDIVKLTFSNTAKLDGETTMNFYNMNGQIIIKDKIAADKTSHTINTSQLPNGIYFVELRNGDQRKIIKVVK